MLWLKKEAKEGKQGFINPKNIIFSRFMRWLFLAYNEDRMPTISLAQRPQQERIAIARKGGQTVTPRKRLARLLQGLKICNPENKPKTYQKILDLLSCPEAMGFDLVAYLHELRNDPSMPNGLKVMLLRETNNAYRTAAVLVGRNYQQEDPAEDMLEKVFGKNNFNNERSEWLDRSSYGKVVEV